MKSHCPASIIADFADPRSDYKDKSNAASDGGTSGCGFQLLPPPTSGIGLDLSPCGQRWMDGAKKKVNINNSYYY